MLAFNAIPEPSRARLMGAGFKAGGLLSDGFDVRGKTTAELMTAAVEHLGAEWKRQADPIVASVSAFRPGGSLVAGTTPPQLFFAGASDTFEPLLALDPLTINADGAFVVSAATSDKRRRTQ